MISQQTHYSSGESPQIENSPINHPEYNTKVVKQFAIMTVVWGIVGMLVGVIIAAQLVWPDLNFGPWFHFGRLRPLHTNAVIFAFGGCALFASSYYVVQRTSQAALISDRLAALHFWGWQLVIVAAAITLPLGMTSSKEYAELEWPIDILITIVWVCYAIVFFGTIVKRRVKHIYVANWFFGAFVIAVAVLHIINSLAVPVSLFKSYSIFPGTIDAMVQWWYGHNAVGFFLTAGFLGMMYYFVPKQAERPIYSYRLSIVHFWALIAIYIWAGPHHLHYSTLPDWAQSLGMVMSIILLAPSWGGMINGMMTLSGAWHKLRTDPTLRFLVVSLSFYGMSTFEGPMMSKIAHRPDSEVSRGVTVVLWHVHLRGSDDGDQDGECPVSQHRLDHWPCSLRCPGLGCDDLHRLSLSFISTALWQDQNVQRKSDQCALLDVDHRHGAVYRLYVGQWYCTGFDVAGL